MSDAPSAMIAALIRLGDLRALVRALKETER